MFDHGEDSSHIQAFGGLFQRVSQLSRQCSKRLLQKEFLILFISLVLGFLNFLIFKTDTKMLVEQFKQLMFLKGFTQEILASFQILFIRARILRSEGKWAHARVIFYEVLHRILALIDSNQLSSSFPESTVTDIADDYEEVALSDPTFEEDRDTIKKEVEELLHHDSAESEGIVLDQLKERLDMEH